MKLALHLPINGVSFGQVSTLLLRTIFDREQAGDTSINWNLFHIGPNADLSAFEPNEPFQKWLQQKLAQSLESHSRDVPIFKLWHLNGSLESFSNRQTLLTFYELDTPTKVELNIARNNKVCVSSKYAKLIFETYGLSDVTYLPLAFDSYSFKKINKNYHTDGRVVFNLCGKLERRKHHAKIIRAWMKKFGKDSKYVLQCAVYNPFLNEQQNNDLLRQIFGTEGKPFNIVFYPHMKENSVYNDFLNSGNVIIGMSGGEGWGLPEFHSTAIGKHAVLLNGHAYQTWATKEMATFVPTDGKVSSVDNIFFKQGEPFNQGNIFDWKEDEFIAACEAAIRKVESNPVNTAGLALQEEFSKEKFLDNVIKVTST